MKKVIAILLSILMVVSLAACGGQSETVGQIEESSTTNEQVETTTPETEETAESTEPAETEETTPAFDTSWAGDEYVMPIPEPPFTQFEIEKNEDSDGSVNYMIRASGDEISALTQDDVMAYKEELIDAGYTCVDYESDFSAESYMYAAYTEDCSALVFLEFHIQMGAVVITIDQYPAVENTETESNSATLQLGNQFPKIPDGDWVEKETTTDTYCYLYAKEIDYNKIVDFCDMLITEGYSIVEEGEPYRANISRKYINDAGHMVKVRYEGTEDSGSCYLTIRLEN